MKSQHKECVRLEFYVDHSYVRAVRGGQQAIW